MFLTLFREFIQGNRCGVWVSATTLFSILFITSCARKPESKTPAPPEDEVQLHTSVKSETPWVTGHRRRSSINNDFSVLSAQVRTAPIATCTPLIGDTIYRFIDGHDTCPIEMTQAEIDANLNDPWAVGVLRKGLFPNSVASIVAAINTAYPSTQQNSYMVGEGSQISPNLLGTDGKPIGRNAQRHLRYAVTWKTSSNQNESTSIFLSAAPGGKSTFLQVIAWDDTKNLFNFYDFGTADAGGKPTWSWAGDSSWARKPQTVGEGCFDCHHNGVTIMKEFNVPWNNWNSALAAIPPSFVPQNVASEKLFQNLQNAPNFQNSIRGVVQRYYGLWLRSLLTADKKQITDVPEILRHLIVNTTVQLDSTLIRSNPAQTSPPNASITGLPKDFFLWDSVLRNVLNLNYQIPNTAMFERTAYDTYLKNNVFALENVNAGGDVGYKMEGTTNFSFFVPVPPQEDMFMIQMMINAKVVSKKFVAAVLMVDFPNPVFSTTRESLYQYAETLRIGNLDAVDIPNRFAANVLSAASNQASCTPSSLEKCTAEQQFLHYWNMDETQWKIEAEKRITQYMAGISKQFSEGTALDSYMRLSVSRRHQFATIPVISNLCEMPLLLPRTSIPVPAAPLKMNTDGTVIPGSKPRATSPATCLMQ